MGVCEQHWVVVGRGPGTISGVLVEKIFFSSEAPGIALCKKQ